MQLRVPSGLNTIRQKLLAENFREGKHFVVLNNAEHDIPFQWKLFSPRARLTVESVSYHAATKLAAPTMAAQLLLAPNVANKVFGATMLGIIGAFSVARRWTKRGWAARKDAQREASSLQAVSGAAWRAAQKQAEPRKFTHFVLTRYGGKTILLTEPAMKKLKQLLPNKPVAEISGEHADDA